MITTKISPTIHKSNTKLKITALIVIVYVIFIKEINKNRKKKLALKNYIHSLKINSFPNHSSFTKHSTKKEITVTHSHKINQKPEK